MGFDGFFFGRIDYDDKRLRLNHTAMEMVWRGSASLQAASDIFTGVTYNGYGPPSGFCFDTLCRSPPIQVNPCACVCVGRDMVNVCDVCFMCRMIQSCMTITSKTELMRSSRLVTIR